MRGRVWDVAASGVFLPPEQQSFLPQCLLFCDLIRLHSSDQDLWGVIPCTTWASLVPQKSNGLRILKASFSQINPIPREIMVFSRFFLGIYYWRGAFPL